MRLEQLADRVAIRLWEEAPPKFAGTFRLWNEIGGEQEIWRHLARTAIAEVSAALRSRDTGGDDA